jgi:hypothetical protein
VDVFDAMSDAEWTMLCRLTRAESLKFSELSPAERLTCMSLVRQGWMVLVKCGGHKWFVDTENPLARA